MRVDRAGRNEQAVSRMQCDRRLSVLLPDPGTDKTWKVIAAGCKCRGLIAPGSYSVSQTITSWPCESGSSLSRRGVWVMPGLACPPTAPEMSMHKAQSVAMRTKLTVDVFAKWVLLLK
jgi:hypothetical protein